MKIYIICPDTVTGGTECLHQLGYALKLAGASISMSYHNEGSEQKTRKSFSQFGIHVEDNLVDSKNILIVFPENLSKLTLSYPNSLKSIFWLSVDNFFPRKGVSTLRDFIGMYNLRRKRLNISQTKNFIHLSQSYYSTTFLNEYNMESTLIGDYLNDDFFKEADAVISRNYQKLDQVCFNPAKGKSYIDYLKKEFPNIVFVPIENMSRLGVIETLSKSKMYLDLGFHPGKDRIPREAAILGACVATSKFGSAKNNYDVPIPDNYKFDIDKKSLNSIPILINYVYKNYENESNKFNLYRANIRKEKQDFLNNCSSWFQYIDNIH